MEDIFGPSDPEPKMGKSEKLHDHDPVALHGISILVARIERLERELGDYMLYIQLMIIFACMAYIVKRKFQNV